MRYLALLVVSVACASAPRQRAACDPVAPLGATQVYPECALDGRLKITRYPHPNTQVMGQPTSAVCYSADFDVVIDTSGRALPETARLVRTNNQRYADEMKAVLGELRYVPGTKDGQPVYAAVRYEGKLMARPVSGRAPPC